MFWCLKESFIKALGVGFSFGDLKVLQFSLEIPPKILEISHESFPFLLNDSKVTASLNGVVLSDWNFVLGFLDKDHIFAVASGPCQSPNVYLDSSFPNGVPHAIVNKNEGFTMRNVSLQEMCDK